MPEERNALAELAETLKYHIEPRRLNADKDEFAVACCKAQRIIAELTKVEVINGSNLVCNPGQAVGAVEKCRAIAAKDDARLTVVANYEAVISAKDRIIAAKDAEIASIRALVKELTDALNASCDCHSRCDGCDMADESKFDCPDKRFRALVLKAREVCK